MKGDDYFSDEEMKNAAHRADIELAKEREGTEGYAHQISYAWAFASLDYYATYSERLHAVTRADIAKYLDAYILGKPFIFRRARVADDRQDDRQGASRAARRGSRRPTERVLNAAKRGAK